MTLCEQSLEGVLEDEIEKRQSDETHNGQAQNGKTQNGKAQNGKTGLPIEDLIRYMTGAAQAIDHVNELGIQHCDIKPGNVLVIGGSEKHAKVCDFGLAQEIGDDLGEKENAVACTPAYADPVVLDGEEPVDTTDLFCLAMTYAELRLGRLPFHRNARMTRRHVLEAKRNADYDLAGIPEEEQKILLGALAADPAERTFRGKRKSQDFVDALRAVTIGEPVKSKLPKAVLISIVTVFLLALVGLVPVVSHYQTRSQIRRAVKSGAFEQAAHIASNISSRLSRDRVLEDVGDAWHANVMRGRTESDGLVTLSRLQQILERVPTHKPTVDSRVALIQELADRDDVATDGLLRAVSWTNKDPASDVLNRLWLEWSIGIGERTPDEEMLRAMRQWSQTQHGATTNARLVGLAFLGLSNPDPGALLGQLTDGKDDAHRLNLDDLAELNRGRTSLVVIGRSVLDRSISRVLTAYHRDPARYRTATKQI